MNEFFQSFANFFAKVMATNRSASSACEVFFESFGEFAIQMRIFYWYDETKTNYVKALDAGVSGLKRVFDEAKIRIPVPFRELRLIDGRQSWREISDRAPEPSANPQPHQEANGSTR